MVYTLFLKYVDLCLSPNLGGFQPLFLQIWGSGGMELDFFLLLNGLDIPGFKFCLGPLVALLYR